MVSKSIFALNRIFGIAFIKKFDSFGSKKTKDDIYHKFFDVYIYIFHNDREMRKTMGTRSNKIFKNNFYIYA